MSMCPVMAGCSRASTGCMNDCPFGWKPDNRLTYRNAATGYEIAIDTRDAELDRLRKIAGRFRPGDIELLQTAEKWIPFSPREEDYRGWSVEHMKEIQDCLRRAQAAAKLAQDGA